MSGRNCFFALMSVLLSVSVLTAQEAKKDKEKTSSATGPLAGLPSKPGPIASKLASLPDRQMLNLGNPAADAKFGKARGRSWCSYMAVAPDLGGAFITGEGVHGYTKPDGYYMDDLWFYDWNAHAWICCYPGTPVKDLDKWKLDQNGFVTNPDGQIPPVAGMVHSYNLPAYSPELKKFSVIGGMSYSCDEIKAMFARLGAHDPNIDRHHPYFYNVMNGRWEHPVTTNVPPEPIGVYGSSLMWLPTTKKYLFNHCGQPGTWLLDPLANTWSDAHAKGPEILGYEGLVCYDSKRHLVHRFAGNDKVPGTHFIYDVAANEWRASKSTFSVSQVCQTPYETNMGTANYDSVNDVIVLWVDGHHSNYFHGAYVYLPDQDDWIKEPVFIGPRPGWTGFYSPAANAHYFFNAGDSETEPGDMWVWRYGSGPAKDKKKK